MKNIQSLKTTILFGIDGSCLSFYCKQCGSRQIDIEGNIDITKADVKVYCWKCHKYSNWKKESKEGGE